MTSRLVIAPNWIGDAVMSLPVLRALRRGHPGARLAVLARRGPAAVYRAEGSAGEVLERGSFLGDVRSLRSGRFDEVWLLPNSLNAALVAFFSGAPRRLGYSTDSRGALLTDALAPPPQNVHQLRDYDALLRHAGVEPDPDPPRLPISKAAAERAHAALNAAWQSAALDGARVPNGFVALCPGSATAPEKRWPAERYATLARVLAASGIPCVVAVGPAEGGLGRAIAEAAALPLPVIGADLDPVELAAVLASARAVASNDSGPAHLAAAVGTPTVVFFGPTDPRRTAPTGGRVRVLERMGEVTTEDAVRAVEELLR
ncbi:MAG TPA: lipopolysaccharide heptosyltransferase II [Thermoanaerobaculia bacterium]